MFARCTRGVAPAPARCATMATTRWRCGRRVRCRACRVTHVLLPAVVAPRRADTTAVIGSALLASARGTGYRRIAAQLDRPLSTVRRWIRAVRDPNHVEWLCTQAVGWLAQLDRDVLGGLRPEATRLGEALTALAAAAVTLRARVAPRVPAWTLIACSPRSTSPTAASSPDCTASTGRWSSASSSSPSPPTWTCT
jgi:hypothetical protein